MDGHPAKIYLFKAMQKIIAPVKGAMEERGLRQIASDYDFNGYKRIYLVHIRKTGGTSLNKMFLSLSGIDPTSLYKELQRTSDHRILSNGLIYVGWKVSRINKGNYFYAFSHTCGTFTVSCFRDPVERVLSHYNMLMEMRIKNINSSWMVREGKWLGSSFDDFLSRIPREHLLHQLYMFSRDYDLDEAIANVRQLSHYFFSDTFDDGVNELNRKTGLSLEPVHTRKTGHKAQIDNSDISRLREILDDEYRFLDGIREAQNA